MDSSPELHKFTRRAIAAEWAQIIAPALIVVMIALAGIVMLSVLGRVNRTQQVNARTLRDLHCAVLGYQGPAVIANSQIEHIIINPTKDCGPAIPINAAAASAFERDLLTKIDALISRPSRVVVTQGPTRTIIITRTVCRLPNGRSC